MDEMNVNTEKTETSEYVVVGEESFKTKSITTGINSIDFTLADMNISDAVAKFSTITKLEIAAEDLKPYGVYTNLSFESAMVDADKFITVRFHIATDIDVKMTQFEKSQEMQNNAIDLILMGGAE